MDSDEEADFVPIYEQESEVDDGSRDSRGAASSDQGSSSNRWPPPGPRTRSCRPDGGRAPPTPQTKGDSSVPCLFHRRDVRKKESLYRIAGSGATGLDRLDS